VAGEAAQQATGTTQSSQGTGAQQTSASTTAAAQGGAASAGQTSGQQTQQAQATQQQATQAAAPARPDWLPENFHDAKTGPKWDDFGKHYAEVITRDAAEQIRRNALPAKPDDYKIELPKDFVVPQGVEFKFDDANPALANARALYHDIMSGKVSGQEGFSKLLGLYAAEQVTQKQNYTTWAQAEQQKLGANGPARITAIEQYLTGKLGPDTAKLMMAGIAAAGQVEGWEKIIAGGVSQGAASFSQSHRDPGAGGGRPTEEQWAKMSPAERLDYTRSPAAQALRARAN